MLGYADLANLPEDERIKIIGAYVVNNRKTVAVAVDDQPGKVERYVAKLVKLYPTITRWEVLPGLVPKTRTIKIYPPKGTPPCSATPTKGA